MLAQEKQQTPMRFSAGNQQADARPKAQGAPTWKVLIIDDDPAVHDVTRLALGRFEFAGRGLTLVSAHSSAEGRVALREHPDAAVVLLDVVMETDSAGLDLVSFIRGELKNAALRIILRTGQPGQAPERSVIVDYDINDYKHKSDLTAQKLFTAVTTALRCYRDLKALEGTRKGLEAVIAATATIFQQRSMEKFAKGVLEQLVALLELSPDAFYGKIDALATQPGDDGLRVIAATGGYEELLGANVADHLPVHVLDMVDRALETKSSQFADGDYVGFIESHNGDQNLLFVRGQPLTNLGDDSLIQIFMKNVSIAFDNIHLHANLLSEIEVRKLREEENEVLARLPEEAPMPVLRIGFDGGILYANTASQPLMAHWRAEHGGGLPDAVQTAMSCAQDSGAPIEFELTCEDRTLEGVLTPVVSAGYANLYCKDVTEAKRAQADLEHLATHDPLTGLPNRALFLDRLRTEMQEAQRTGRSVGVSVLDLDDFKIVNDTLGHAAGDELLEEVARRIAGAARRGDLVARFGGDEFAILQPKLDTPADAGRQAQRVIDALSEPVTVGDRSVTVGCSIGITTFPNDADTAARLYQNADMAMYLAKSQGRNGYQFYDAELDARSKRQRMLEAALRPALDAGEFDVFYQPKIDLRAGRIVGAEALLRWRRADEGFVSPAEFIPVAERSGFITELGGWVLDRACRQFAEWTRSGLAVGSVAVNLSPAQFRDGKILDQVNTTLENAGLDATLLELEVTESLAMENIGDTSATLRDLKAAGVSIAIDDFGTGYSSLSILRKLPFTKIKIDRSFVTDLDADTDAQTVVRTIVALAHTMAMSVVAEGIERQTQAQRLRDFGCEEAQGFFYSKPVAAADYARLVANWRDATTVMM